MLPPTFFVVFSLHHPHPLNFGYNAQEKNQGVVQENTTKTLHITRRTVSKKHGSTLPPLHYTTTPHTPTHTTQGGDLKKEGFHYTTYGGRPKKWASKFVAPPTKTGFQKNGRFYF